LPRDTPVIAPTCARKTIAALDYTNVTYISPGDDPHPVDLSAATRGCCLTVTAGPGAVVGPPWSKPQLALLFEFSAACCAGRRAPIRVYHETHGFHDDRFLDSISTPRLDVVISPVVATSLPALGNYAIVNGVPELLAAVKRSRPRAVVPFDNSNTPATGLLSLAVQSTGGAGELAAALARAEGTAIPQDLDVITPVLEQAVLVATAQAV
jgi:Beta-lactamase superfamily domain